MKPSHSHVRRVRPKEHLYNTAEKNYRELSQDFDTIHVSPMVELEREIEAIS
jgi:hypothetical protein